MSNEKINVSEIIESLEQLELTIIEYEQSVNDEVDKSELVHLIFRYAHNLKSSLFVINKSCSSKLIHSIESNFDLIRKGKALPQKEMLQCCLSVIDLIKSNLVSENEKIEESQKLTEKLEQLCNENGQNVLTLKLSLNSHEYNLLQDALKLNLNIFQVEKLISSDITQDDFDNLYIYEDIKEIGNLIKIYPNIEDFDKTKTEAILKILFATKISQDDLGMYIFDPIRHVKVDATLLDDDGLEISKHKPAKMLVVDDDFFSRRLLKNIISEFGLCDIASDGEEALFAFRHELENNEPYDIITLDVVMDKIDGHEILRLIRELERSRGIFGFSRTKIVISTAISDIQSIINFFKNGCDAYLVKPITDNKIINLFKKFALLDNIEKDEFAESNNKDLIEIFLREIKNIISETEHILKDIETENNIENIINLYKKFYVIKNMLDFIDFTQIGKITLNTCVLLQQYLEQASISKLEDEYIDLFNLVLMILDNLVKNASETLTDTELKEEDESINVAIEEYIKRFIPLEKIKDLIAVKIDNSYFKSNEKTSLSTPFISDDTIKKYLTEASHDIIPLIEIKLLELEENRNNLELAINILGFLHNLKGNFGFLELGDLANFVAEIEDILDEISEGKIPITHDCVSNILEKIDILKNTISDINQEIEDKSTETYSIGSEELTDLETATIKEKFESSEILKRYEDKVTSILRKKDIRVDTDKLDKLFDLVGELITVESIMINDNDLMNRKFENFRKTMGMLNKITRELQEITMSVRMIPLENLFNKMKRVVRDLSQKTGKQVNFTISGQDTEMDKNIIEELTDPLVHILRNSIDHGIETEEERIRKNKDAVANLSLTAKYEGNEIFIIIEDDGKGLDREKIIKKAIEKGFLDEYEAMNTLKDKDIWKYIFLPGFSTSENVSELSGRGVGLDIVKKNLEKLRGKIDIQSNANGTKFTLKIPLTLAILDGMLIKIGNTRYAIPILSIQQSFRPNPNQITVTMDGQEVVKIRDELFPVIRLHEIFNLKPDNENLSEGILIMVEANNKRACLFADDILGQQQIVIKGLDNYIGDVNGIMGCMILGNGEIGLILDIDSIIERAEN